jgi:hypothetical protein
MSVLSAAETSTKPEEMSRDRGFKTKTDLSILNNALTSLTSIPHKEGQEFDGGT